MSSNRKRMAVTGREGQIVRALLERGAIGSMFEIVPVGRPELDLSVLDSIEPTLRATRPDVILSAAAYTAVDQAENEPDTAMLVNGVAPGKIAAAAAALDVPVIHISTDYVFDGSKPTPYVESDAVAPIGSYGRSKLSGEKSVAQMTQNHAILRTAWVYSPFNSNFVKTMLRLAESRDSVDVVDDQIGNPTSALDIADGIIAVASGLVSSGAPELRGVFHMSGRGEASWADFAEEIFARSVQHGGPTAQVRRISSVQYPTPAGRPSNSRLDCTKLKLVHNVKLPKWKLSVEHTVKRLLASKQWKSRARQSDFDLLPHSSRSAAQED